MAEYVKVGAVGIVGESTWDHKGFTRIMQIIISKTADNIRSLQFQYLENHDLHTKDVIGSPNFDGSILDTVLFYSSRSSKGCIREVEGCTGVDGCITKLVIHTNTEVRSVFDRTTSAIASNFSFKFGWGNQFGGFYGTHSTTGLTSIGVYFNRFTSTPESLTSAMSQIEFLEQEFEDAALES